MLKNKEIEVMRKNGKIHKKVFDEIKRILKPGVTALEIEKIAWDICKAHGVLPAFYGVYGYPNAIMTSVNDVVVHGLPREGITFENGDIVTFDFGVKDTVYGVNTDAAFTAIVGNPDDFPEKKEFLHVGEKALKKGLEKAVAGNTVGDIGYAIQSYVEKKGYHIVKELTGHGIGKSLHEEPYIYNYGNPGTGPKLKAGMTICIEPIIGFSTAKIVDEGDREIYMEDGGDGIQFEHTVLITDGEPEIII